MSVWMTPLVIIIATIPMEASTVIVSPVSFLLMAANVRTSMNVKLTLQMGVITAQTVWGDLNVHAPTDFILTLLHWNVAVSFKFE